MPQCGRHRLLIHGWGEMMLLSRLATFHREVYGRGADDGDIHTMIANLPIGFLSSRFRAEMAALPWRSSAFRTVDLALERSAFWTVSSSDSQKKVRVPGELFGAVAANGPRKRGSMARNISRYLPTTGTKAGGLAAAGAIALAGAAVIVNRQATKSEKAYPPKGSFVTAGGVRLHYMERGQGRPVIFLHGNGMMVEDMLISGVLGTAANRSYRAIAFDRPGFGHSERPRGTAWTAAAQAELLPRAFALLGIERPIVVGHSLGTMVALALALNHPDQVSGLVLASGYYYPTARSDVVLVSPPAIPLFGDLLCYTVAPLIGEMMAPRMIAKMFAPEAVPARFNSQFPVELMLRPSQLSASSKDATHMIPDASAMSGRYVGLSCPVAILAGDADKVVSLKSQALRLHDAVPGSMLDIFAGSGHMIHHADPARVVRAIDFVSGIDQPGVEMPMRTVA